MDSITIRKILNSNLSTSKVFSGCFPCDLLPHPTTLQYPAALIINLDNHQDDGSHWVAVFAIGLEKEIYYFDSLSLPIMPIIQTDFLNKFTKIIKNTKPFQNPFANTCAHYCICFVLFLSNGYTFNEFILMLSKNENTDFFVTHIVNEYLNKSAF